MLSNRETVVLELMAEGLTYSQIGETLNIARPTAKRHIEHVLTKLGAKNSPNAVSLGYRYGILKVRRAVVNVNGPDSMAWSA